MKSADKTAYNAAQNCPDENWRLTSLMIVIRICFFNFFSFYFCNSSFKLSSLSCYQYQHHHHHDYYSNIDKHACDIMKSLWECKRKPFPSRSHFVSSISGFCLPFHISLRANTNQIDRLRLKPVAPLPNAFGRFSIDGKPPLLSAVLKCQSWRSPGNIFFARNGNQLSYIGYFHWLPVEKTLGFMNKNCGRKENDSACLQKVRNNFFSFCLIFFLYFPKTYCMNS